MTGRRLFTPAQRRQLVRNHGLRLPWAERLLLVPVCQLGLKGRGVDWMVSELDVENGVLWGTCSSGPLRGRFDAFSFETLRQFGRDIEQRNAFVPRASEPISYWMARWDRPL